MNRDISKVKFFIFFTKAPPDLLLYDFAGRTATELWWMNQEFSHVDIIPPGSPCSYITWGMNKPIGCHSSEI
jgi:hypothetical protein